MINSEHLCYMLQCITFMFISYEHLPDTEFLIFVDRMSYSNTFIREMFTKYGNRKVLFNQKINSYTLTLYECLQFF